MKKQYFLFLVLSCIWGLFQPLSAQHVPQTTIPISEIRNMLGIGQNENFALVYKGDTLASQFIDSTIIKTQFFDERITSIHFGDSVEFQYSLPNKEGSLRLGLPDSTKLFSREFRFHDSTEHIVRYDGRGEEIFKMDIGKKQKTTTRFYENAQVVTNNSKVGWSINYKQLDYDSSYTANYSSDSTLVNYWLKRKYESGEELDISSYVEPSQFRLSRSYSNRDSSYYYSFSIRDDDTNITDRVRHKFNDLDSTYECEAGIINRNDWFNIKIRQDGIDSTYGYSSFNGGSVGWMINNETFKISKSYNLKGDLIARGIKKITDGEYDVEEILERQDTFYHVVNYYHKLHWKEDTNNVTSYFPYVRQVYLNEDSVVIKELNYSFETENDWPTLTIMEGDSTWTENTSEGFGSKYARKVFICPGAITSGSVLYKPDENTFNFIGVGDKKVKKSLLKNANTHFDLMFGIGVPPLYFIYVQNSGSAHHSFSRPNSRNDQSFNKILSEGATRKASLYINGELKKIDCTFLKLDFDYSFRRKRAKKS